MRLHHEAFHFAHGRHKPDEQRPRNNGVTDIQLENIRDCGNHADVMVIKPVSRMDLQAGINTQSHGLDNTRQLGRLFCGCWCVGKMPGMNLDTGRTGLSRRFNLFPIRIDKQGNTYTGFGQLLAGVPDTRKLSRNIKTTLGG